SAVRRAHVLREGEPREAADHRQRAPDAGRPARGVQLCPGGAAASAAHTPSALRGCRSDRPDSRRLADGSRLRDDLAELAPTTPGSLTLAGVRPLPGRDGTFTVPTHGGHRSGAALRRSIPVAKEGTLALVLGLRPGS